MHSASQSSPRSALTDEDRNTTRPLGKVARLRGDRLVSALFGGYTALFFAFLLAPILIVVFMAFSSATHMGFPPSGFSLRWFWYVFEYKPFLDAIIVTLQLAILSAVFGVILGVPAALAIARSRSKLAEVISLVLLSPLSMPLIVVGFAMLFFFSAMGLGVSFLSLLIAHTVVSIPYIVRTIVASYRSIAQGYEEAAMALGATRWQVLFDITLPLIRPGIFAGCLFSILVSIDNLPISYFFGSPSTNVLPVIMLSYVENQFDPSIAALSTIQLIFAVISLIVVDRIYGLGAMAPKS